MSNWYRKDGSVLHIGEKKSGRGVIGEEREKMAANRDHLLGTSNRDHLLGTSNRDHLLGTSNDC